MNKRSIPQEGVIIPSDEIHENVVQKSKKLSEIINISSVTGT